MSRPELLEALDILDSAAEPAFDALVQMASLVCACPISLFSLTDVDRQWFKARVGMDVDGVSREQAFCTHAIRGAGLFEVTDASQDARFSANPLVTGDAGIRFYAGQPILYDGVALGTLCVIDRVPRDLDASQKTMLGHLSVVLADLLHGRMEAILHRREQQRLRDFAHLSGDWLWETDPEHRHQWSSGDAAVARTLFRDSMVGTRFENFEVLDRLGRPDGGEGLVDLLDRGEAFADAIVATSGPMGRKLVAVTAQPMHDVHGRLIGFRGSASDVTERIAIRATLSERDSVIRKIASQVPGMIYQFQAYPDGRFSFPYVSEGIGSLFELAPGVAEVDASKALERVHAEDMADFRASIEASRATGAIWNTRFRVVLPTTGVRWLQGSSLPERRLDGSTIWHGYITDVTESHARDRELAEAHAALVGTERRLRALTDNLPALISYVDRDERYAYVNANYCRIFGVDASAMIGRTMRETHDAAIYAEAESAIRRVLAGNRSTFEGSRTVRGHLMHYQSIYVPDVEADGSVAGFYAMAFDLTRQKEAELRLANSERMLRGVTDNLPGLVCYVGVDNRYQFANATYERWLGIDHHAMIGRTVDEVFGLEDAAARQPYVARARSGERVTYERRSTKDGRTTHHLVDYVPDFADNGKVRGVYALTTDVTARREAELQVSHRERKLRDLTDALPVLISSLDADARITYANEAFRGWLGVHRRDVVGRSFRDVIGDELYEQRAEYLRLAFAGQRVSFEIASTIGGSTLHAETTYLPDFGPDGRVVGVTTLSVDVTDRIAVEKRLSQLAHFDALTELPNRLQFDNRLAEAADVARREGETMALMFLDVDHFKRINDTRGHVVGDTVLREFARRLRHSIRPTDFVARLGGDEFVVLLERVRHIDEARWVAQKVLGAVELPFVVNGSSLAVTASVGIALYDEDTVDTVDMLAKADVALYRAKEAGRNTFAIAA